MHLFIVIDCKTPNCKTAHVLMHLGKKGQTPPTVQYWICYPLMIECPICGETYDYSDSEERFWQKELPEPPTGYFNGLVYTH